MSTEIEAALRAVFEEAGHDVTPRPDLADQVRAATRRRRRRIAIGCTLAAAVIVAAGGYAAVARGPHQHRPPPAAGRHRGSRILVRIPAVTGVGDLAVAGRDLYVTTAEEGDSPPYALSAYNRVTGALIGRVRIPGMPAELRTGPGGYLWLSFFTNQGPGDAGIWLLNADLSRHSSYRGGSLIVLPTGPATALLAAQHGLTELRMPAPGTPGQAVARADPSGRVNGRFAVDNIAAVGGRIAVQVTDGYGYHGHLVIAGHPRVSFGGGNSSLVGTMTAQDRGIWATTGSIGRPNAGPLVRLSPGLRVVTPPAVSSSPILRQSEQVWSHGSTVWVASAAAGHQLVCFSYRGQMGPLATIRVHGQPAALAAAADAIYVSFRIGGSGSTSDIRAYPVPAACR